MGVDAWSCRHNQDAWLILVSALSREKETDDRQSVACPRDRTVAAVGSGVPRRVEEVGLPTQRSRRISINDLERHQLQQLRQHPGIDPPPTTRQENHENKEATAA